MQASCLVVVSYPDYSIEAWILCHDDFLRFHSRHPLAGILEQLRGGCDG